MSNPSTTTKSPKSEQTKKNIITVYLRLISEKKWDKISVKELCSHADITRGTFYQYYSDIYDLMEQIQSSLLEELKKGYAKVTRETRPVSSIDQFVSEFDYAPPKTFIIWFQFCKRNDTQMKVLLDPKNGDLYFINKLKKILSEQVNQLMDDDMHPHDALRNHFAMLIVEMHFLAARSWLESAPENMLSTKDIINLLNATRVGAGYLQYKQHTNPNFEEKMDIPDDM